MSKLDRYSDSELYAILNNRRVERQKALIHHWSTFIYITGESLGQFEHKHEAHAAVIAWLMNYHDCREDEIITQGTIDISYFQPHRIGWKSQSDAYITALTQDNFPVTRFD